MNRHDVFEMLRGHKPFDTEEARNRMVASHLLKTVEPVFYRECNEPGHVCGSAMVINMDGSKVLLNKHGITNVYINFGGHADGDEDVFGVSKRELEEEAGITDFACSGELFDIDIHSMYAHVRKGVEVPEHIHLDFTWLYRVPEDMEFRLSDESHDIKWFSLQDAMDTHYQSRDKDAQMGRIYRKIAAGLR